MTPALLVGLFYGPLEDFRLKYMLENSHTVSVMFMHQCST